MAFTNEQMSKVILVLLRERVRIYEYQRNEQLIGDARGVTVVQTIFEGMQGQLEFDKFRQAELTTAYDHFSQIWSLHLKWPGKDESVLECVFCGELNTTARETCEDCGRPLT